VVLVTGSPAARSGTSRNSSRSSSARASQVLVAGGGNPSATLAAELYDPVSGKWTATARMTDYHGPEAVLLQDGRVLLAGSGDAGDVYSPATGTWTTTGPRGSTPSSAGPRLPGFSADASSASVARGSRTALRRDAVASRSRAPSCTRRIARSVERQPRKENAPTGRRLRPASRLTFAEACRSESHQPWALPTRCSRDSMRLAQWKSGPSKDPLATSCRVRRT
jgi:hypothetical protein